MRWKSLTSGLAAAVLSVTAAQAQTPSTYVEVDLSDKRLTYVEDGRVRFEAPVAIGRDGYETPLGWHRILTEEPEPCWTPTDSFYRDIAAGEWDLVRMRVGDEHALSDGYRVVVRPGSFPDHCRGATAEMGLVSPRQIYSPIEPGKVERRDGKLFVPPIGAKQRHLPGVMGPLRFRFVEDYYIHGTNNNPSIGEEASRGCVRLYNHDVLELGRLVDVGTPVHIKR